MEPYIFIGRRKERIQSSYIRESRRERRYKERQLEKQISKRR